MEKLNRKKDKETAGASTECTERLPDDRNDGIYIIPALVERNLFGCNGDIELSHSADYCDRLGIQPGICSFYSKIDKVDSRIAAAEFINDCIVKTGGTGLYLYEDQPLKRVTQAIEKSIVDDQARIIMGSLDSFNVIEDPDPIVRLIHLLQWTANRSYCNMVRPRFIVTESLEMPTKDYGINDVTYFQHLMTLARLSMETSTIIIHPTAFTGEGIIPINKQVADASNCICECIVLGEEVVIKTIKSKTYFGNVTIKPHTL